MAFEDNCLHSSDHLREQVADIWKTEMDVSKGRGIKLVITYGGEKKKEMVIYCLHDSQERRQKRL